MRPLLWLLLGVLVFAIGLLVARYRPAPEPPPSAVVEEPAQPPREVILYFASADGRQLVAEPRALQGCGDEDACLRATVEALLAGPLGELLPVLPAQAELRGVQVTDSLVLVDFSPALVAAHPGGTQSELLTVYALTDTLVANFPYLRRVQLLVDGQPLDTLRGHLDLRQPLSPDFSLVEEGVAPLGKVTEQAVRDGE
jgi:spore germination protein GerM